MRCVMRWVHGGACDCDDGDGGIDIGLEAHGAEVSTEDANHKFLKSLPTAWSNLAMTMRTKPDVDTLSLTRRFLITPLFDTMMVQPVEEIGEDSDHLTDSTPIPIIDQPSSSFNQEEINHLSRLRDMRQRFLKMRHNMRKVLDLQKEKDGSSKEIVCFAEEGPESLERTKCQDLQESLGAPEDASKQGRSIEDIDEDVDVSLVDETQESTKFDGT
ncbi:hypothetical protein Tco_1554738 [Tanacetum coccineum]